MELFGSEFVANSGKIVDSKYYCQNCDYSCCKKYNWNKHLTTSKHQNATLEIQSGKKWHTISHTFECDNCNRLYATSGGLWKHKKKCSNTNVEIQKDNKDEVIMMLIKDNSELKNMIMEVIKNGTHNTTNTNTHTNSHNKAFNLNFFLNETCKDAMNIMDFVDSIKLQLSDLERVGEFGFVDGISNIIVQNLKALDVAERPIHCTDKKREVLYVKDENKWEKDEDKNKIKKAIKRVANKNIRLLPAFKQKYPDCNKSASIHSDQYNKMIVESMDTAGDNENKIITNISKQVFVEKETVSTI